MNMPIHQPMARGPEPSATPGRGPWATRSSFLLLVLLPASIVHGAWASDDGPRPITLVEAVQTALDNSPDIAAADHRIAAARAAIVQAQSAFLPSVTVAQSYTASNSPVRAFMMTLSQRALDFRGADFNDPGTVDDFASRLIGRWQIYDGGRDASGLAAAKLAAEAAEDRLAAARNSLVFEVTRAYYEILKTRRFVSAAEATVTDRETSRTVAEDLRAAGAALDTDVLDADVALAAARADLVSARSSLAVAEAVLSSVVGGGGNGRLTAVEADGSFEQVIPSPHGAAADSRQRPELAAARKLVEEAEKRVRAARASWLPHLSAFGGYDLDSGDLEDFADSWAAGVVVEVDVFDGRRTRGAVSAAQAEHRAALAELRRTELALELDWQRARLGVDEAAARVTTTAVAAQLAERSLTITRERYREGLELFARVLNAETALADARQRRAAALSDYHIAIAALDRAAGKPWKREAEVGESPAPRTDVEVKP